MSGFIIVITGPSGAGKSRLSDSLRALFGEQVAYLSTDSYYKGFTNEETLQEYQQKNFDVPEEISLDQFYHDVQQLVAGKDIKCPTMDFQGGTFKRTDNAVEVKAKPVIIVEGIFALHTATMRELVAHQGCSIFVDAPSAVTLSRRAFRDQVERHYPLESTLQAYPRNVLHGYYNYVKPLKSDCDLNLATWTNKDSDIASDVLTQAAMTNILLKMPEDTIAHLKAKANPQLQSFLKPWNSSAQTKKERACYMLIEGQLIPTTEQYLAHLSAEGKKINPALTWSNFDLSKATYTGSKENRAQYDKIKEKYDITQKLLAHLNNRQDKPLPSERIVDFTQYLQASSAKLRQHRDSAWSRFATTCTVIIGIVCSGIIPGLVALLACSYYNNHSPLLFKSQGAHYQDKISSLTDTLSPVMSLQEATPTSC